MLKGLVNVCDEASIFWHLRKGDRSRGITFTINYYVPHAILDALFEQPYNICVNFFINFIEI